MVCEYEQKDDTLRVNCVGCIYGASLEDYERCMATTIDKLIEVKRANSVILAGTRENEYPPEQTEMLTEIANAIRTIIRDRRLLSNERLATSDCDKCAAERYSTLQKIVIKDLREDPIKAYKDLRRVLRHARIGVRSTKYPKLRACYEHFIKNSLEPMVSILEGCALIKFAKPYLQAYKPGDRSLYRELFHPTVRPNFMLTKYMLKPPKKGRVIDRYMLPGQIKVEIFEVPGKIRYHYHITPPEFVLSEDKYTILDAARRYMAAHEPRTADFADPKRMREVFSSIGRDMITDLANRMGVKLEPRDLNELTDILTRYTAGFGILEILLADSKIQDIYINSPIGQKPIYIYHGDFMECETNLIPTMEDAERWATRFRIISGRPLDEANPVLDTDVEVPGGRARVAVITRTLSPDGLGFALRRHRERPWTYPLFLQPSIKYFNPLFAGLMSFIVDGSRTFLIAGTRSSGKTSFLTATMLELMQKLRIITAEDTLEIPVNTFRELGYNIERLKSRSVITRVETEMPADEAIRTALRLGDSVLIIGEVRSVEARALFESMRIGALANTVAGTIHAASPYGVFDRVVNDLGVPPTSFKAVDFIIICSMLRSADGLHRFRRVLGITEVRKHWREDPLAEGAFFPLMEYSSKRDELVPTQTLLNGESVILNEIASGVREWAGRWDRVWENINLRARIKQTIVEYALRAKRPEMLEAPFTVASNNAFHKISERIRREVGAIQVDRVYEEWLAWLKKEIKG